MGKAPKPGRLYRLGRRILAYVVLRPLLWLITGTQRQGVEGAENVARAVAEGPAVFTCWHNRNVISGAYLSRRLPREGAKLGVFISLSRDGEWTAELARSLGVVTARGSISRGGLAGLRKLQRMAAREGVSIFTAADGSKGPIYVCQTGTVVLAQTTGAPVVPMAFAAERCWRLKTWDRLILPKPFSRVRLVIGEPIEVPRKLPGEELEKMTALLAGRLDEVTARADAAFTS